MGKTVFRQIFEPLLFYMIGFGLSWIVFELTPSPYAHGLDWYSLIALLTFLMGVVLAIRSGVKLLLKKAESWTFVTHLVVLGGLLLALAIS